MEHSVRLPGSFSLTLLFLFAGCEPPAESPSTLTEEPANSIDSMH